MLQASSAIHIHREKIKGSVVLMELAYNAKFYKYQVL